MATIKHRRTIFINTNKTILIKALSAFSTHILFIDNLIVYRPIRILYRQFNEKSIQKLKKEKLEWKNWLSFMNENLSPYWNLR